MTITDQDAANSLLQSYHLEGRLLDKTMTILIPKISLFDVLSLSEHPAVQLITTATKQDILAADEKSRVIGEPLGEQPEFRSYSDTNDIPLLKRAPYEKLSKTMLALVTRTLDARLADKKDGLVRFTKKMTDDELRAFFPGAHVIVGNIGGYRNVTTRDLLRVSNDPRISYFEAATTLKPNPSMGGSNGLADIATAPFIK